MRAVYLGCARCTLCVLLRFNSQLSAAERLLDYLVR